MAFTYSNGYIPLDRMIVFFRGRNKVDGDYYHALSPSTYRKHLALVDRAKERTGRTLEISRGWSAYRPYHAQVHARRLHGRGAAEPGKSSHGGFWEGKQTLAMDYGNWWWVYEEFGARARAEFFADCRAVGLAPGMIHPSRGHNYPDEPWHVIDLDPWAPVSAGIPGVEFKPAPKPATPEPKEEEDEDMKMKGAFYERSSDGKTVYLLFNEISGFEVEHTEVPGTYNNRIAKEWETNSWVEITEGHAKVIKASLAKVRTRR